MKIDDQLLGATTDELHKTLAEHTAYAVNRTLNAITTANDHPTFISQADVRRRGRELLGVWQFISDVLGASNIPADTRHEIHAAIEAATKYERRSR